MYHSYTHSPQPHLTRIPHQHCSHPHTPTAHTHATQTTVHASQSPQQPHAQHRVLRQPHKQTKDYHRTTNTTQTHRPIIVQVNINRLRNKPEELKLLIHDTHVDIITIQETKLTPKAKTPKNNLLLNPDKTTCTLFTPDPAEYTSNLDLTINNKTLPMATHPKVLGLTLDPKLTYSTHIHNISVQAHKPLQIIKALTATGWGKQKETRIRR